jgi:predicted transcriptional regulator
MVDEEHQLLRARGEAPEPTWVTGGSHTSIARSHASLREKTISFHTNAEKVDALSLLAAAQDRPRNHLINEAITNCIELHAYQDALVGKGLEDFRKGRVVSHAEVVNRLNRVGRARDD